MNGWRAAQTETTHPFSQQEAFTSCHTPHNHQLLTQAPSRMGCLDCGGSLVVIPQYADGRLTSHTPPTEATASHGYLLEFDPQAYPILAFEYCPIHAVTPDSFRCSLNAFILSQLACDIPCSIMALVGVPHILT